MDNMTCDEFAKWQRKWQEQLRKEVKRQLLRERNKLFSSEIQQEFLLMVRNVIKHELEEFLKGLDVRCAVNAGVEKLTGTPQGKRRARG